MKEAWRWLPVFRDKKIKICRVVSLFLLVEKNNISEFLCRNFYSSFSFRYVSTNIL